MTETTPSPDTLNPTLAPGAVRDRLDALGISLPAAVAPVGSYVPWVQTASVLVLSGQLPMANGALQVAGRLGDSVSLEQGCEAARLCAINLLAQLAAALEGDLNRVQRIVRLGGFVACTADFHNHPKVLNGASDLMVAVFGDAGRHARAAVGCPSLPLNAAVEVDLLVQVA